MDKETNIEGGDTGQNPPNLMTGDETLLEKFRVDNELNQD